jgi:hypothetical protein
MTGKRSMLSVMISAAAFVLLGLASSGPAAGLPETTIPYKVEYQGGESD